MSVVKIKRLRAGVALPRYESDGAAGMDLRAFVKSGSFDLQVLERRLVPTGLALEIPPGYEIQIRPRSGLALKHGVSMVNTPGTIDSDYRGEIGVILINMGNAPYTVLHGARIAQMVLAPVTRCTWQEVEELATSDRGADGFGSTGG